MKRIAVAGLLLAGLLTTGTSTAQVTCVLLCDPPRPVCVPAGSPLPPIIKICKPYGNGSTTPQPAAVAPLSQTAASASAPACAATSYFNEETQSYEWQMDCD